MIKITPNNIQEIENKHLTGLQNIVQEKINLKQLEIEDPHLQHFLNFLKLNVKTLLCGKKSELEDMIEAIETTYFISSSKLSKILDKRTRRINRGELNTYLSKYAREKHLANHLPLAAYSKVNTFEKEVKKLSTDKWSKYQDVLEEIFDYTAFTKNKKNWSAYDLVFALNVTVCPYCNRSFVTTLKKDNKKTRAVLDHYYAKSLYPYLALSLYNLIPSCYVCNSSFKGDIDFYKDDAIYPYEEEFFNLATFKTDFSDKGPYDHKYLLGISEEFKVGLEIHTMDSQMKKKIQKSIEIFALEDMYNTHQDIVRDLIRNAIVNNDSRIEEIIKMYPELFSSKEEVLQSLYLNYMDNEGIGKRPLSKLTQDISKEIGLLIPSLE